MSTFRSVLATLAVTIAAILGAAGSAQADAEITTSNDASGDDYSYEGTTNSAVDHMAGEVNDGNIEGDRVTHVWKKVGPLDENGEPTWISVPIDYDGVPQAAIVHG